jgi:hypothetical protein
MKETWSKHQDNVKEVLKNICSRHVIQYIDKPPFKGNPDNTIQICDEYIIFDAKSPGTDDLSNFPSYIKSQTESVKKYASIENVRKEVFLVIPSNTVDVIDHFSFNMGEYNVYIVTIDVLEPLIMALKRLEDYEFVKDLTPEERENICRVIGRFAHTTKRRIQVDQFFARQFLDILAKCETDVPDEMLGKVVEFEKAEKLNPPMEKRAKQIPSNQLQADSDKIQREAQAKSIIFPLKAQEDIMRLPLYEGEEPNGQK